MERYTRDQTLNSYVEMLDRIYGPTQNYAKSRSEILAHLSEVCGIAGKYIFRRSDLNSAIKFLPKIFGWACALFSAVSKSSELEEVVLRKFPTVCPYCRRKLCNCWAGDKPTLDPIELSRLYYEKSSSQPRTVNDFELMFKKIYGKTWLQAPDGLGPLSYIYLRMIEELAEVSEAVRFYHLYPQNFENEIADFLAWWFALSVLIKKEQSGPKKMTDEVLWNAYPGHCLDCVSMPCFCHQGPVRELVSKAAPGMEQVTDGMTGLRNQGSYESDLADTLRGRLVSALPIACVRADVDNFRDINTKYGHAAGDAALKHVASTLRAKARMRDRVYRVGGDEFAVLMPDLSEEEAFGSMKRVLKTLACAPVSWTSAEGKTVRFHVSLSIGVAECDAPEALQNAFEIADKAAYASKEGGKNKVTRASPPGSEVIGTGAAVANALS